MPRHGAVQGGAVGERGIALYPDVPGIPSPAETISFSSQQLWRLVDLAIAARNALVQPPQLLDPLVNNYGALLELPPPPEQVAQLCTLRVGPPVPTYPPPETPPRSGRVPGRPVGRSWPRNRRLWRKRAPGPGGPRAPQYRSRATVNWQQPFVAARWFTDGQGGVVLLKVFGAAWCHACCGVVETQHRGPTGDRNVQVWPCPRQCRLPLSFSCYPPSGIMPGVLHTWMRASKPLYQEASERPERREGCPT